MIPNKSIKDITINVAGSLIINEVHHNTKIAGVRAMALT